ncbi:MAG: response regulator [Vulcanimicrobiaceae bacterium]
MIELLLVEDNPGDVRLTREALTGAKVRNRLSVVGDGEEALDFLYRRGPFASAPRPNLILLDFNLPRRDGREVLEVIKKDPDLLQIPVIVLTTSQQQRDIVQAYGNHANAFITKPVDFDQFVQIIAQIESFWFEIVQLPHP